MPTTRRRSRERHIACRSNRRYPRSNCATLPVRLNQPAAAVEGQRQPSAAALPVSERGPALAVSEGEPGALCTRLASLPVKL